MDNRRLLLTASFLMIASFALAQDYDAFNEERLRYNRTGLTVLGSWAIANMAVSPILKRNAEGSMRHFYDMNVYWNAVNLIIAGAGYWQAMKGNPAGLSLAETLSEQHSIEIILLFNTALDVAYMTGGLYLIERGNRVSNKGERLRGFGRSIVLQGAFLFSFDLLFYLAHHKHGAQLYDLLSGIRMTGDGLSFVYRF